MALLTGRDDPLLAQWQYGTLAAQLVAWTLPPRDEQEIDVQFSPGRHGKLNVEVTSLDYDGAPRTFYRTASPSGARRQLGARPGGGRERV